MSYCIGSFICLSSCDKLASNMMSNSRSSSVQFSTHNKLLDLLSKIKKLCCYHSMARVLKEISHT